MKRRHSIRWQLPLSYAGIALLTAMALGSVLLTSLRSYYAGLEKDYLERNATAVASIISEGLAYDLPPAALQAQMDSLAFFSRTRIRFFNIEQQVIADSGDVVESQPLVVAVELHQESANTTEAGNESYFWSIVSSSSHQESEIVRTSPEMESINPQMFPALPPIEEDPSLSPSGQEINVIKILATDTLYGFDLQGDEQSVTRRSKLSSSAIITNRSGETIGLVILSDGPAYGHEILASVAWGVAIAGGIAVILAGGAGWVVSHQISTPLLTLSDTTRQMAGGDLGVRVEMQRSDEIGLLAHSFNGMAMRIQEMVVAQRQIIADAAHELHTPLTALHTNLEIMADEPEPDQRAVYLVRALAQLHRLEVMTSDLLLLSQLEAGILPVERARVDLTRIIREAGEVYASRAEQVGLLFLLETPSKKVWLEGSAAQLHRALASLLENAIKYTPTDGMVKLVLTHQSNDRIEIRVEDTGIGIMEEDIPRLFERFHRGCNAMGYPGSGLGLAITQSIIQAHGGNIEVQSSSKGTCFLIIFRID